MSVALITLSLTLAAFPSVNDEAYTKKIREYTTEPFFLTELVDHLPASKSVPTPEKILGHIVGAPNILTHTDRIYAYFRALASSSKRVRVWNIGQSEEGRDLIIAAIADEKILNRLDKLKEINATLGDPRRIPEKERESISKKLCREGIPMYWLTGGMHCTEAGPPEMLMELAYRLAVEDSDFIKSIRENVVTLITPALDADGRDRFVDTYMYRKKNPNKPAIPLVYWGKYVAHDINRDGMAISTNMSRAVMNAWFDLKPQVLHDLHESVPYLYISTGTGPYNAWLDPMTIDEWHEMAYHEVAELTKWGVPGVWTHGFYDGWAPNYMFYAANGHNAIGRFYETFGGTGADTGLQPAGQSQRDWFRPNPPFPMVRWSLRNNTNLMQSGVLLGLRRVALNRESVLRSYYLRSLRSVHKAITEGPAAYVLPSTDSRKGLQRELLALLKRQGIEVSQLSVACKTNDGEFPAGSYVVRMDQPYSRMADMMLDTQYYNPTDPRPYDDCGWTLGPLFNVKTVRVKDLTILDKKLYVTAPDERQEIVTPGSAFSIPIGGDFSAFAFWAALKPGEAEVRKRGDSLTFSMTNGLSPARMELLQSLVPPHAKKGADSREPGELVHFPRIAVVHSWTNTQNEGWFRLALDTYKIPYVYLPIQAVKANSKLRSDFDMVLLPPMGNSAQSVVNGIPLTGEPIPWKPLPDFPHLGGPDSIDDIRGGMDLEGVMNLRNFVREGGVLVCIQGMCAIPIDYGIVSGISIQQPKELNAPGGVYKVEKVEAGNPITLGYDDSFGVYFSRGPLLTSGGGGGFGSAQQRSSGTRASGRGSLSDPDVIQGRAPYVARRQDGDSNPGAGFGGTPRNPAPRVLLRFASGDGLLMSGLLDHSEELEGKIALADCPVEKGRVVLFAFNPMWRMQTHGSFQFLFNAAMSASK